MSIIIHEILITFLKIGCIFGFFRQFGTIPSIKIKIIRIDNLSDKIMMHLFIKSVDILT